MTGAIFCQSRALQPGTVRGAGSLTLVGLWGDCSLQLQTTPFSLPAPPSPQAAPQPFLLLQTLLESTSNSVFGANSHLSAGQATPYPSRTLCRGPTVAVLSCPTLLETPTQSPFPSAAVGFNPWRTEFIESPCSHPHPGHILPNI